LLAACTLTTAAQDTAKTAALEEVTVKCSRTIQKVDGQWNYPSKQQIENSSNGYSLLAKLTLPHIRVDEAMNSITALKNLGTVQMRINGIVASREDLQALITARSRLRQFPPIFYNFYIDFCPYFGILLDKNS